MANRTNKQNRTFSRTCSVCSSSAPHRTEPNNTLVRFVFSRYPCSVLFDSNSNRTVPLFGSCSASSNYSKQSRALYSLASELWIAGVIPGLGSQNNGRGTMEQWPRNNGRGTMDEEQWLEEQWQVTGFPKYSDIASSRIIKNSEREAENLPFSRD